MVLAHGVVVGADLPVPLWLVLYGAGGAVLVSFVGVDVLQAWVADRERRERPLPDALQRLADSAGLRAGLRGLSLAWLLVMLAVAALGAQSSANPAPVWLYVWVWVGLVPASLLLGPVVRFASPLRAVSAVLGWVVRGGGRCLPARVGVWPATAQLAVFVWLELAFPYAGLPRTVLVFGVTWLMVNVAAAVVWGREWYARGEPFEVYSTLLAHLAPIGRGADGRLVRRRPLAGLNRLERQPGLVALLCVLIGGTLFDGIARTPVVERMLLTEDAGRITLVATAGLVIAVALAGALYAGACWLAARLGGMRVQTASVARRFAPTLVPVAAGYTVAHYLSLLLLGGQLGYILASDPFGTGHDLLGTADWLVQTQFLPTDLLAVVQVGAVVLGHVLGVVFAHDLADHGGVATRRSQYPLVAAMVALTSAGLFLLLGN